MPPDGFHDIMHAKAERLRQQGLTKQALALVSAILSEDPSHPGALLLSGIIKSEDNPETAVTDLEAHLALCPDSPEGLFWLAMAHYKARRYERAAGLLQKLTALTPESHFAHRHLGIALEALNRHDEAHQAYQQALNLSPENAVIRVFIGVLHAKQGSFDKAADCFRQALNLSPNDPDAHKFLARTLVDLNRDEEAYAEYRQALAIRPDDVDAMVYLATLLIKTSNMDEAEELLTRALRIAPRHTKGLTAFGRIRSAQGLPREALHYFQQAYSLEPERPKNVSNLLFTLNYLHDASPEEIAGQHFEIAAGLYPPSPDRNAPHRRKTQPGQPLRIGYLSADFHNHSVSHFFEPILQHHDRGRFLPILYYGKGVEDETTERLKNMAFRWHKTVGMDAQALTDLIASDGIDILVDLSGHSGMNRLDACALRPAPLQVSWIGYPHSTGLPQIDYYLSDHLCDPEGMTDQLYAEKVYRLPRVFCTYAPPTEFPPVTMRNAPNQATVTFGCFNNFAKTNELILGLWSAILRQVPGSTLVLKSSALQEGGRTFRRVVDFFKSAGVDPHRLILQVVLKSQYDHLEQYSGIDIALDTYPYHGTTTTCEALWMGVPVVSLAGRCHASRVGVSLLSSVGLADLVAHSAEEYIALAVALAENHARRTYLREQLRHMMAFSPLMDAAGITRDVENAFNTMYFSNYQDANNNRRP